MTANQYLDSVLANYHVNSQSHQRIKNTFSPVIREWAGSNLISFDYSGSTAKGTSVKSSSDVDFFASLSSHTNNTLKEIYDSLYTKLSSYSDVVARKQNVSIGVTWEGYNIDITPGRNDKGNTNKHKLYSNKKSSWILTNVKKHIDHVTKSGRSKEIKLLKIWKKNHSLNWPSIYIELFAIEALKGKMKIDTAGNLMHLFHEIELNIQTKRISDPSNSNNIISGDLSHYEKLSLAQKAKQSRNEGYWKDILW